ncbi:MAG TPA: hypothetical protein VHR97_02165 [Candidatus Baltobacteraceae bacterium]|jgi:predicted ATPase|nr:hypothetical protein [Candidatus Baltobacteraceae bacterium]
MRKKLLLVLDNCEHVLGTAAQLAASILSTASDVKVLATSRQALDITGETAHRLPSLPLPADIAGLTVDEALRYGAIVLFTDRAKAADTRFALTDVTAPVVAEICRRLDGIPLAIELAAARVKVLSIPSLAQRLNERFRILTGGRRDVLPRQKTLSALIDWSYDLLTAQEQRLFTRLGIFAGEFGVEAVTAVCGGEGHDQIDSFELLTSLTDKSLVAADTSGERERYRLLESTRAYAYERLAVDERARLARRHAEYYRDQAQAADDGYGTGSTFGWLEDVELELDDYRAALAWALTKRNDAVVGGTIAGALSPLWQGGLGLEGRYWIGLALEQMSDADQPRIAARLWLSLGGVSSGARKHDAAQRSIELYALEGDATGRDARRAGRARSQLAFALCQMGRLDEANDAIAQALAAMRECRDAWGVANGLNTQAMIVLSGGDRHTARALFAQALTADKALEDEAGAAAVLGNMAELEFDEGRPEEALRLGTEVLAIYMRGKSSANIAIAHVNGAAYRIALGDFTGARESAVQGLHWGRRAGSEFLIAVSLQHLSMLAALSGNSQRGAQLLGYVDAQYLALGLERELTEQSGYEMLHAALSKALSGDEIAQLAAQGAAWPEDRALEEALKA